MNEVEAVKSESQRTQVLAQLEACGQIYADIWQFGINTALRISDLLALTMDQLRQVDPERNELTLTESKTNKRKTVTLNAKSLEVVSRRLTEHPDDKYLFQSISPRYGKRGPAMPINRRSNGTKCATMDIVGLVPGAGLEQWLSSGLCQRFWRKNGVNKTCVDATYHDSH